MGPSLGTRFYNSRPDEKGDPAEHRRRLKSYHGTQSRCPKSFQAIGKLGTYKVRGYCELIIESLLFNEEKTIVKKQYTF